MKVCELLELINTTDPSADVFVSDGLNNYSFELALKKRRTDFNSDLTTRDLTFYIANPTPSPSPEYVTWDQINTYLLNNGMDALSIDTLQSYINTTPIDVYVVGGSEGEEI